MDFDSIHKMMDNQKCKINNHHIKQEELIINDNELEEICEEYQFDLDITKKEPDLIEEIEIVNPFYDESTESPLLDINDSISKYMIEIGDILNAHEVITVQNCVALNIFLQKYLNELRDKIVALIDKCKDLYRRNSDLLIHQCKPHSYKSKSHFCGAPFFKNVDFYGCWSHPDYNHRKDVLMEFFPINIQQMRSCNWTLRDKVDLLQGVKSQMIKFIGGSKSIYDSLDGQKIKVFREQVKTLYDQVKSCEHFSLNFGMLSTETLKGRHDSHSCAGMWNMYMRPDINRTEFTETENKAIHMAVKDYNCFDWYQIANSIDNRTALQCIIQYWTVIILKRYDQITSTFKWTKEQDALLIQLVKKHTIGNNIQWIKINSHFPSLEKNRICARYFYSCKPGLIKGAFTIEEDIKLLAAIDEFGEEFSRIPLHLFPGRSVAQLRSHYHNKLKDSTEKNNWSLEDDTKLLTYVETYGFDWLKISQLFNNRFSRTGCRTRFNTITKYLSKCPNNTIANVPRRKRKHNTNINLNNWMNKLHELPNLSQEKPKSDSKRTLKIFYVDRLRVTERCFYEFFKYSFDYYYGYDFSVLLSELTTLSYISKALEYEEIFVVTDKCPEKLSVAVFENLVHLGHYKEICDGSCDLPPSWGSILGIRSLFIFKSCLIDLKLKPTTKKIKIEKGISEVYDSELGCQKLLFKKRFRKVFSKACLLSLLHSTDFKPNCSIELKGQK
ncbi:SNAPC4 family protein [Megaselia abdita]